VASGRPTTAGQKADPGASELQERKQGSAQRTSLGSRLISRKMSFCFQIAYGYGDSTQANLPLLSSKAFDFRSLKVRNVPLSPSKADQYITWVLLRPERTYTDSRSSRKISKQHNSKETLRGTKNNLDRVFMKIFILTSDNCRYSGEVLFIF
jgi:hypothetical protein